MQINTPRRGKKEDPVTHTQIYLRMYLSQRRIVFFICVTQPMHNLLCFRVQEIPVTDNIRNIIVPQVRAPYLQTQVSDASVQIVFLSMKGKISSINRSIVQGFPRQLHTLHRRRHQTRKRGRNLVRR